MASTLERILAGLGQSGQQVGSLLLQQAFMDQRRQQQLEDQEARRQNQLQDQFMRFVGQAAGQGALPTVQVDDSEVPPLTAPIDGLSPDLLRFFGGINSQAIQERERGIAKDQERQEGIERRFLATQERLRDEADARQQRADTTNQRLIDQFLQRQEVTEAQRAQKELESIESEERNQAQAGLAISTAQLNRLGGDSLTGNALEAYKHILDLVRDGSITFKDGDPVFESFVTEEGTIMDATEDLRGADVLIDIITADFGLSPAEKRQLKARFTQFSRGR